MTRREIHIHIERYIRGKLTPDQIDELWIEFLRAPEWYDYFITELHLRALFKDKKGENSDFVSP